MAAADSLTAERLREVLEYDPATGIFTWRVSIKGGIKQGDVAGCVAERRGIKYRAIRIDGRLYREHRLAWLYLYGCWPPAPLDHRNGMQNIAGNLRPANGTQNLANMKVRRDSTTGLKGVTCRRGTTWIAQISVGKKHHYLGSFRSPEEAAAAYDAAALRFFGEFAKTNAMLGLIGGMTDSLR